LCQSFAEVGARLLLGARRIDRLKALAEEIKGKWNVSVYTVKIDVTRYEELEKALSGLPSEWKEVEVLVNNAGLSQKTDKLYEGDVKDWDRMIDTNVKAFSMSRGSFCPEWWKGEGAMSSMSAPTQGLKSIRGKCLLCVQIGSSDPFTCIKDGCPREVDPGDKHPAWYDQNGIHPCEMERGSGAFREVL